MGGSAAGSSRRRMRPRRRASASASSPPSSKIEAQLGEARRPARCGASRAWRRGAALGRVGRASRRSCRSGSSGQGRRSSSSQRCLPCRRAARTRRPTRARRHTRGRVTPSKTMGSVGAPHVDDAPAHRDAARRRRAAASTSGSSGTRARYSLTISSSSTSKTSVGAGLDEGRRAAVAVGEVGRADEPALAADLHQLHALGPALDDAVQRKRRRLAALDRAVEHRAVGQRAVVVHLHLVGRLRRRAGARPSWS